MRFHNKSVRKIRTRMNGRNGEHRSQISSADYSLIHRETDRLRREAEKKADWGIDGERKRKTEKKQGRKKERESNRTRRKEHDRRRAEEDRELDEERDIALNLPVYV